MNGINLATGDGLGGSHRNPFSPRQSLENKDTKGLHPLDPPPITPPLFKVSSPLPLGEGPGVRGDDALSRPDILTTLLLVCGAMTVIRIISALFPESIFLDSTQHSANRPADTPRHTPRAGFRLPHLGRLGLMLAFFSQVGAESRNLRTVADDSNGYSEWKTHTFTATTRHIDGTTDWFGIAHIADGNSTAARFAVNGHHGDNHWNIDIQLWAGINAISSCWNAVNPDHIPRGFRFAVSSEDKVFLEVQGTTGSGNHVVSSTGVGIGFNPLDFVSIPDRVALSTYDFASIGSLKGGCLSDQRSNGAGHITMVDGMPVTTVKENALAVSGDLAVSGNLGIGTANPAHKLDIFGTSTGVDYLRIGADTGNGLDGSGQTLYVMPGGNGNSGSGIILGHRSNDGIGGVAARNFLRFYDTGISFQKTSSEHLLHVANTGNVGIGTITPDIWGSGIGRILMIGNDNSAASALLGISAGTTGTAQIEMGNQLIKRAKISALSGSHLAFYTNNVDSGTIVTERLRITSDGKVGVGNASPTNSLQIGSGGFSQLAPVSMLLHDSSTDSAPAFGIRNDAYVYILKVDGSDSDKFKIRDGTNSIDRIVLTNGGKFGIGTTNPLSNLVVSNNANENLEFTVGSSSFNGGVLEYINRNTASIRPDLNYFLGSGGTNGAHKFYTNGVERFRITNTGIGIQTTTPTAALEIGGTGTLRIPGAVGGTGTPAIIDANGDIRPATIAAFLAGSASAPPITTAGDTDTGIFFPAADTVAVSTGGTERVRVTNAGYCGIGRFPPRSKLDIGDGVFRANTYFSLGKATNNADQISFNLVPVTDGSSFSPVYAGASTSGGSIIGMGGGGSGTIVIRTSRFGTDSLGKSIEEIPERLRITDLGDIGVATATPDALLSVNGVASFGAGTAALPSIAAFGDLNTGLWFPAADTVAVSTGGSERMRIDNSGNVRIGTSGAMAVPNGIGTIVNMKLNIAHGSGITGIAVGVTDGTRNRRLALFVDDTNNLLGISYTFSSSSPSFVIRDGTAEVLRITNARNIGIGTTTPEYKLDVNGPFRAGSGATSGTENAWSYLRGVGISDGTNIFGSYGGFVLQSNTMLTSSARRFLITNALDTNKFAIIRSVDSVTDPALGTNGVVTSGTADFVITNAGNVGIGTANPSSKLTIEGLGASAIVTIKGTSSDSGGNQLSINNDENVGMRFLTYGGSYTAGSLLNVGARGSVISATGANPFALTTTTSQPMLFGVNSIERMRITSDGNVGIGTTNPSAVLQIEGAGNSLEHRIMMSDNVNGAISSLVFGTTPGSRLKTSIGMVNVNTGNAAGDMVFSTNSGSGLTQRMRITSVGNVGIGKTNPTIKIDIEDATSTTFLRIKRTFGQSLQFATGLEGTAIVQVGNGNLNFHTNSNGDFVDPSNVRMTIANDGNVGIGTTNSLSKLHVAGAIMAGDASSSVTGTTILRSRELTDEYRVVLGVMRSSGDSFFSQNLIADPVNADTFLGGRTGTAAGGAWIIGSDGSTRFVSAASQAMTVGGAVTTEEKFKIDNNGDVTLRGTSGYRVLSFNGKLGTGTSARNSGIRKNYDWPYNMEIFAGYGTSGVGASLSFFVDSVNEAMKISPDGKVGIATTNPGAALEIGGTGTLRIAGTAGGTGTPAIIDANGDLRPQTSSLKFKHDIQDLVFDPKKLSQLRPVQYRLKSDNATDFGFIAEELHPVFPLAVNLDKDDSPYSVKYGQICVLLTKGWQAHEQKMHAQANTVKSLRDKVAEQDRRIATHEDTIATIRTLLNFSQLENQRIREENRQLKEKQESLDARLRQLEELLVR